MSPNTFSNQPINFSIKPPYNILNNSNEENQVLQKFAFDFLNNANSDTPSEFNISSLSSLCTTLEILDTITKGQNLATSLGEPVTHLQKISNTKLFSLLTSANSLKIPQP